RETLGWKSLDDIRSRIDKACGIIKELAKAPLRPHVVVFPEYSIPVQRALKELQRLSNEYGFILVPGSDSIRQPNTNEILNQCPIILPGHEPVWITKQRVSRWEEGLVDEPTDTNQPLLTWTAGGVEYWMSVHICLDFSLAHEQCKEGGGIF